MSYPTWEARELPILKAIARHDEDASPLMSDDLAAELPDLDDRSRTAGLQALIDDGYVIATDASSFDQVTFINLRLSGEGRRAVGQWPPHDAYDVLLRIVEAQAAAARTAAERTRLERLRDAITGVGREVVGEVIADVLRRGG